jgi:hypothetical protein
VTPKKVTMTTPWQDRYPLNTFTGETKAELVRMIEEIIREEANKNMSYKVKLDLPHLAKGVAYLADPDTRDMVEKACLVALTYAFQEGGEHVLAKIDHDQRKLLDGFGHPKECEDCKKIIPSPDRPINEERV